MQAGLLAGWIKTLTPTLLLPPPYGNMRPGEIEAISLAQELSTELLVDEGPCRRRAVQEGIAFYGTLDVLLLAKAESHIDAVRPYLDALRAAGFYFTTNLYTTVLRKAEE